MFKNLTGRYFRQIAIFGFTAIVISGCNSQEPWDREYVCSGQERSSTYVKDRPNNEKVYQNAIDFHIRSNLGLVKSYQVSLTAVNEGQFNFNSKTGANWASGNFAAATGVLDLVEGRTIVVDGVSQETRITGRYNCQAPGGTTL